MEDGRWGVCRVLHKSADPLQVVVATSAWLGDKPPYDRKDPRLTTILHLTHHSWGNTPCLTWVSDAVPADALRLGKLPVRAAEARTQCNSYGGWDRIQPLLQWRWDHEREAVLAEDERDRQQREAAAAQARVAYLPAVGKSLEELREETPFPGWSGYTDPVNLRRARRFIRDGINELLALGPGADDAEKLDVFRRCVERFNASDVDIDTIEREDICELLDRIADAAGLTDYDVSAWRDW
jgi:hypothetical protein